MRIFNFNNIFLGTASKKYVKPALKELCNLDPDFKLIDRFPEGIFSFAISYDRKKFIEDINNCPPVFLRHIHPVEKMILIGESGNAPEAILEEITSFFVRIPPGRKVSIQTRRIPGQYKYTLYTFKQLIDPYMKKNCGAKPTVKFPDLIISIFITDSTRIDYKRSLTCSGISCPQLPPPTSSFGLIGLSSPDENLCEWSGGTVRFEREDKQVSRAEFKLLEAFTIFPIELKPGASALDLGSSPGGWTRILAKKGCRVTAVDLAPLDRNIEKMRGVHFIRQDARHFRGTNDSFDIVTCDMNRDPIQAARAILSMTRAFKTGASLIMTIKFTGKNYKKIIDKTLKILKDCFVINRVRQLYHNRDEVTVWGNKK